MNIQHFTFLDLIRGQQATLASCWLRRLRHK
eukprot:COSAG01_NODE_39016_length_482_cov_0.665796_1_plen_30_part_10